VPAEVFATKTIDGPDGTPVQVPGLAPVPAVDGVVLTQGIRATFKAGEQKALPLLIGSTSNESSVLAAFGMNPGEVLGAIVEAGGEELQGGLDSLKALYHSDPEVEPRELDNSSRFASLVLRDILFTMQARWISDHHSKKSSSWRYYFSYVTEADRPEHPHGVAHGNEVIHTLDTGDIFVNSKDTFTENDRAMSEKVTDYWFSFASAGTPSGSMPWPKNEFAYPTVQLWEKDNTLKLGEELELQKNFRRARLNQFILLYPKLEDALSGQQGQ
jgi:para-nitrobenzyl esterase